MQSAAAVTAGKNNSKFKGIGFSGTRRSVVRLGKGVNNTRRSPPKERPPTAPGHLEALKKRAAMTATKKRGSAASAKLAPASLVKATKELQQTRRQQKYNTPIVKGYTVKNLLAMSDAEFEKVVDDSTNDELNKVLESLYNVKLTSRGKAGKSTMYIRGIIELQDKDLEKFVENMSDVHRRAYGGVIHRLDTIFEKRGAANKA